MTAESLPSRLEGAGLPAAVLASLLGFVAIDRLLSALAGISVGALEDGFLHRAAFVENPLIALAVVAILAVVGPRRLLDLTWGDLQGPFQAVATVLVLLLTWRRVTEPYDFLHESWHLGDRSILLAAAGAAILRPVGLVPFVVAVRVLAAPSLATVAAPGNNIDELPVLVLIAIGVGSLIAARWRSFPTAALIAVITGVIGAQFFLPGRIKVRAGWVGANQLENLPLNGYLQGWLGAGSGDFAQAFADLVGAVDPAMTLATILFEVGWIVAVLRRRLLASWLVLAVGFHLSVLASLGFVFLEFIVVELLVVVLLVRSSRPWVEQAFRGATPFVVAASILAGPIIFDPPELAWFDGPVVVRYEIDGVDAAGESWALEPGDFAPYDDLVAFSSLELGPTAPAASAYGAVSRSRFDELNAVESLEQLAVIESRDDRPCASGAHARSVALLEAFVVDSTNTRFRFAARAPDQFLNTRPGPNWSSGHALDRLVVRRITLLRTDLGTEELSEPVLEIERDGESSVVRRQSPNFCWDG